MSILTQCNNCGKTVERKFINFNDTTFVHLEYGDKVKHFCQWSCLVEYILRMENKDGK